MKAYGHTWTRDENDPTCWHALAHHRFHCLTWPFGPIHKTKILVEYPYTWREHSVMGSDIKAIGIGLQAAKSRAEAMRSMLKWIDQYRDKGGPGPEETITRAFEEYPSLFKTRADVLDHLFFSCGTGSAGSTGRSSNTTKGPRKTCPT